MRKRTVPVLIIFAMLFIIIFTACDALVSPAKERINMYDSANPIPAATELSISLDGAIGNRSVSLSWNEGTSSSDTNISGFIIVYKKNEAPQTIWDGQAFGKEDATGGFVSAIDNNVDVDDSYPRGYEVFYSIFTYGRKDDDSPTLEVDEDGTIRYAEYYNFVGPVSKSVMVSDRKIISGDRVWFLKSNLTDDQQWMMGGDTLEVGYNSSQSNPHAYGFIDFNFDDNGLTGADVSSAIMTLTTSFYDDYGSTPMYEHDLEIAMVDKYWDEYTDDDDVLGSGVSGYDITTEFAYNSDDSTDIDLTSYVRAWCSEDVENYGLRISNDYMATMDAELFDFYGVTQGTNAPHLTITCYYE